MAASMKELLEATYKNFVLAYDPNLPDDLVFYRSEVCETRTIGGPNFSRVGSETSSIFVNHKLGIVYPFKGWNEDTEVVDIYREPEEPGRIMVINLLDKQQGNAIAYSVFLHHQFKTYSAEGGSKYRLQQNDPSELDEKIGLWFEEIRNLVSHYGGDVKVLDFHRSYVERLLQQHMPALPSMSYHVSEQMGRLFGKENPAYDTLRKALRKAVRDFCKRQSE